MPKTEPSRSTSTGNVVSKDSFDHEQAKEGPSTITMQNRRIFLQQIGRWGTCVAAPSVLAYTSGCSKIDAKPPGIPVTDFHHSYIRWTLDTLIKPPKTVSKPLPMTLNRVRMPIEATATLTHKATGDQVRYVLGAECRTEQVWVKRDVWHDPNASMTMIAGEKHCVIEKHWARADFEATLFPPKLGAQPERQLIDPHEAFAGFAMDVAQVRATELNGTDVIMDALAGRGTVIARTEYTADGYAITLEYPVKTSNYSERERYYQIDTGPILFPGLTAIGSKDTPPIMACRLAYIAHNDPQWAEFLVCVPTVVTNNLKVYHYSQSVRVEEVRNRMFSVAWSSDPKTHPAP
ncbi:MAG: hypothetical protein HY735_26775 [Verrucomicrobia bacterium]|nr:hypothetical protein [Verrucomicrobiota bacterium]